MTGEAPPGWPEGVARVSLEDLRRLGIDPKNQLFWDGRRVEVRNTLILTGFQKAVTVIVTVCAVLGGLGGFVTGLNNGSAFLCARGLHWLSCPVASPVKSP
jgi:hypothetical protein